MWFRYQIQKNSIYCQISRYLVDFVYILLWVVHNLTSLALPINIYFDHLRVAGISLQLIMQVITNFNILESYKGVLPLIILREQRWGSKRWGSNLALNTAVEATRGYWVSDVQGKVVSAGFIFGPNMASRKTIFDLGCCYDNKY